jgi:hypothetical protein
MKPQGNLKVILVYEYLGRQIPIAETCSRSLLPEVKRSILEDAEARVNLARTIDPVLHVQEEAEFRMKKKVLGLLLKESCDVSKRRG